MIEKIVKELENKSILILGYGKEGKSTYDVLSKYINKENITILCNENIDNINYINEEITRELLLKYDCIFKSPGISLKDIDVVDINVTSQLEMVLKYNKENVIAITGTKGKSTTSSLIYSVLKEQNKDVLLLGNIGVSIFEEIENIKENTLLVLECSSHQLEYVKHSPKIGILLNLHEEHLDHYNSVDDYYRAKLNIVKYQSSEDYFISLVDNIKYIDNQIGKVKSNTIIVGKDIVISDGYVTYLDDKIYSETNERLLLGNHNLVNIMFVIGISKIMNLDIEKAINSINKFSPLKHRMQYVGTYEGIKFYNDSICTIPAAVVNCCETIKDVDTLIIGGLDRGIDYTNLVDYINSSDITNIICLPDTGHNLEHLLNKKTFKVFTMNEVVKIAKEVTKKGKSCILSPAAPSYGFYKNFEDRGDAFIKELND